MENREAIEWLKGCVDAYEVDNKGKPNGNVTCELIQEVIDMAISALKKQEQDRWIPVTERLPEEDGKYLVTFDRRYAEEYALDDIIGIAPFEVDCEGFGIWQEDFHPETLGSLGSDWVDIQVTAWRPLPEAFEVEEES